MLIAVNSSQNDFTFVRVHFADLICCLIKYGGQKIGKSTPIRVKVDENQLRVSYKFIVTQSVIIAIDKIR